MKAVIKPRINLEGRSRLEDIIPLSTPMILFVDPASACNFRCAFCPTGDRELIKSTGRFTGSLEFSLFKKIIDDLADFDKPLKVLWLYKDGEPFLNRHLAEMIAYAKQSKRVDYIDTTTNGSFLDPEHMGPVIDAGLDKINISVDGMNRDQYIQFTKFDFDFDALVKNMKWLYGHKNQCEIVVKIPKQLITESQQQEFFDTFGDCCDRISLENFAPCWPDFDVEAKTGVAINEGIYNQPISHTETCPYIFYAMSVNAEGSVSACFLDWARKLVIGNVRTERLVDIWDSDAFNTLRIEHLEGRRIKNPVCSKCGQLSHCLPDNIDPYRDTLLQKVKSRAVSR